jgi:hypothetical protein
MIEKHRIKLLFLVIAIILMTVVFSTFYFSESPWGLSSFQADSEALVTLKLQKGESFLEDLKQNGGFLAADKANISASIPGLYTSQVGLQGIILNLIRSATNANTEAFIGWSRLFMAIMFAIVFAIVLYIAWEEFGITTSIIFLVLVLLSTWLVAFSKNLYWTSFTLILPFAIGWLYYPRVVADDSKLGRYLLLTGALVLLKSLNGYEYITNIILSATIAPVYYELREKSNLKILIGRVFLIGFAGIGGFLAAYVIHFLQLFAFTKNFQTSIRILVERAATRTFGENPYTTACDFSNPAILVMKYLNKRSIVELGTPLVWMFCVYIIGIASLFPLRVKKTPSAIITIIGMAAIALSFAVDAFIGRPGFGLSQWLLFSTGLGFGLLGIISLTSFIIPNRRKLIHLALASTWALASTFSWVILARNHMACHLHLNSIVFYIPFGVTLFLFAGYWFESLISKAFLEGPRG